MSYYIHVPTGRYPLLAKHIRAENPNVSFPEQFVPLPEYASVEAVDPPEYNSLTHALREAAPSCSQGVWQQQWDILPLPPEQVAANQAARAQAVRDLIVQQTQHRLDAFAQTRYYDGILSACSYATSTVPKFKSEGQYCVEARDATWAALYQTLADVEAGVRPAPSDFADVESSLPTLTWPD